MHKIVLVTGGFDPLHKGHIEYFKAAAELGDDLWVGVNSDNWLCRKKGKPFMLWSDRSAIIDHLEIVSKTLMFDDQDNTANDAIDILLRHFPYSQIVFANGGDRKEGNVPEEEKYKDHDRVSFVYGVGGNDKINSSSKILEEWDNYWVDRNWGKWRVMDYKKGDEEVKVKELVIAPGGQLSLQKHFHRNEHWYILSGKCDVYLIAPEGDFTSTYSTHDTLQIRKTVWHQGRNPYDEPCHILEVQYGNICNEEDIERRK